MNLIIVAAIVLVLFILPLPIIRNIEKHDLNDNNIEEEGVTRVKLKFGKVSYKLQGEPNNPLLVLVHGFSVPSFCWERNVESLVDSGFQVLTFDLYGRGYSSRPDTHYNVELFSSQLQELIDSLSIKEPFTLVGLSMGGVIAAHFANNNPERVKNIALLAPFHTPVKIGPLGWPLIGRHLTYSFYIPSVVKNQMKEFVEPERLEYWQNRYTIQMKYNGFRRAIHSTAMNLIVNDPSNIFEQLGKTDIETLVLWGENDQLFPISEAPKFIKKLSESTKFVEVKEAGHALQYEKATFVNQELVKFSS